MEYANVLHFVNANVLCTSEKVHGSIKGNTLIKYMYLHADM